MTLDQGATGWHKSSRSATENECVECGTIPSGSHAMAVRDTKDRKTGPVLAFTSQAWGSFIDDLRSDRLTDGPA